MHVNKWIKSGPLWLGAVVATGALVAMSGGTAMAAQQIAPAARQSVVPLDKLPKNAVPYHGSLPTVGATGTAFPAKTIAGGATTRIVGGTVADVSNYPYIVGIDTYFLTTDSAGNVVQEVAICTGTIVSSTQVLTAGDCDTDLPFSTTFVIAGRDTLSDNSSGYVARVQSVWTDQSFNLAALNDGTATIPRGNVSVITLDAPLPAAYTPVPLIPENDITPYFAGAPATIIGYGETTANDPSTAGTLYSATVSIQGNNDCISTLPGFISGEMTCAGNPVIGSDMCNGDDGGPLLVPETVNGVDELAEAGIADWIDPDCGGASGTTGIYETLSFYDSDITAAMSQPAIINLDFFGGGHAGLMAVDGSGNLWYYAGSGFLNDGYNGFAGWGVIGTGFTGFKKLFRVTNWNGDDTESLMGVAADGNLYEWTSDGAGDWTNNGAATLIGTGWTEFSDIMVVNNWTGDGHADLLGRTPDGDLYLYESDGQGGWENNGIGQQIGTGWNEFNTVLTPGDWTGDGHQALIGRTPSGDLYLYESDGQGGWENSGIGQQIGTGWNEFSTFMSPGDWNGDGLVDMVGITPGGLLDLFESDGHGNWLNGGAGIQIGTGWNAFKAVF
jgi:hypothetical protein